MLKSLRYLLLLTVFLLPAFAVAQVDAVTVKELNTYPETPQSEADIEAHPLAGEEVQYTGVVISYPKSSGNATFTEDATNFPTEGGSISRIHIFTVDTTALAEGKEGMYMQIVESGGSNPGTDDFAYFLEELQIGDVVNFTGKLTFFEGTAQFDVTQWDVDNETNIIGNVEDAEFEHLQPLLEPITGVTVDMLNQDNGDGTSYINYENYEKYASAFVEIEQAPVIAREAFVGGEPIGRPNWVLGQNSASIYVYDISLRYRNDKGAYRNSYNYRRAEEGAFIPPAVGSSVRVTGFMTVDDYSGAIGRITGGETALKIVPMEDGVLWLNDTKFVNGVEGFEWPDHVEVLGIAPAMTNFLQTPESGFTSSTEVTVSIDAVGTEQPDMSTSSVDSVVVIYTTPAGVDRLKLTASGNTYSGAFPTFSDLTPVTYYIEAYGDNGLVSRFPEFGNQSFFVSDGAITSIEDIQKPAGGGEGPSNLAGGTYEMDINAMVVSDVSDDGMIVVHDKVAEWGGIYLSPATNTMSLAKGDSINITEATIEETEFGLTYLTNVSFTTISSGNDYEAAIPVITTSDMAAAQDGDAVESYEGMVVKFENVELIDYAGFGEFTVASADGDTVLVNDDFAVDGIGENDIPSDLDDNIRLGEEITALYGVIHTSFGAPKIHPRSLSDIQDDNYTAPVLELNLLSPADSSTVTVNDDGVITWEESEDYDGNDVTYEFVLYNAADTSVVLSQKSDEDGAAAQATVPFDVIDGILENAGLDVGESADFVWNLKISDGNDTLDVAASNYVNNDNEKVYIKGYNFVTLERAVQVSIEDNISDIPDVYSLEQNYPNPFNPTTQISFNLPQNSKVELHVFDMLGRKVATLVNKQMEAGAHNVKFDASALASGMYIYRIAAGSFISTRKMMLIK